VTYHHTSGWTEERVELLKQLWTEGLSASVISTRLGGWVSRSGVIGKVHRLGLPGRATTSRFHRSGGKKSAKKRKSNSNLAAVFGKRATAMIRRTPAWSAEAIPLPTVDDVARVTDYQKADFDAVCNWPISDPGKPDFGFCGLPRAFPGSSRKHPYCEAHIVRAYQSPAPRRPSQTPPAHGETVAGGGKKLETVG
jgi:GcrA cell cycle regulator